MRHMEAGYVWCTVCEAEQHTVFVYCVWGRTTHCLYVLCVRICTVCETDNAGHVWCTVCEADMYGVLCVRQTMREVEILIGIKIRNYHSTSLFKCSNEKRPRTVVSWFRWGFCFAFRWPFRVSSPRNGLYLPVQRVESLLRIRCGRVTPYTCPQIIWLYVSFQWRCLHLYSNCATACIYKEKPPSNKTSHLGFWECDFENVVFRMWFWECGFENVIVRMWFWECDCESVILRMWFWECGCENVILRMWFWECDFENVISRMWAWECDCENVILRMWVSYILSVRIHRKIHMQTQTNL